MKVKYVIINELYPRLCSLAEQHADLARGGGTVTSAGFCSFERGGPDGLGNWEVSCYGESLSCKVKSHPEHDSQLIERMLTNS